MSLNVHNLTRVANGLTGASIFEQIDYDLSAHDDMWISDQQSAVNFRHRKSPAGYQSDWHVAGDPTLIIICQGALEIQLPNGESKSFQQGEQFIAADFLPANEPFIAGTHGHRARVVGNKDLIAVHIKLAKLS